jgi:hypothetical protein
MSLSCRPKPRVRSSQQRLARVSWLLVVFLLPAVLARAQGGFLDPTNFVVLGEGLAAGMADFGLRSVSQEKSFPVQMADQMDVAFPQPLIQGPGIGSVPGFPSLPVRLPGPDQGAVRKDFPPQLFVFNLSVPGFRVRDALTRRPAPPLVQRHDELQSVTNLILGYPALILKDKPLWTQVEYAQRLRPTLVLVALGYYDVLEAAATGDPSRLTSVEDFRASYTEVLRAVRDTDGTVVVLTIPDPLDTAYFTPLASAFQNVRASAADLQALYNLRPDDLLTPNGLTAIALQFDANEIDVLPPGSVVGSDVASQIRARVAALNQVIQSLAQENGAVVYDLHGLFVRVRDNGLVVSDTRVLTRDYLGGFYSLNGYYPGATGHALIANEILTLLNGTFGATFPLIDLAEVADDDPAVRFIPLRKPSPEEVQ